MIKIEKSNILQVSNYYADSIVNMKRHLKRDNPYLAYVFNERKFEELVLCPPLSLNKEIASFNERFPYIDYEAGDWSYFKKYMIGQYEKVRKEILHEILDSLNINVCPYCNRQYIFGADNNRKVSAQFDHFYSKSSYPYLALSFYNLIPCCPTCNKAKGEEQIEINPYIEGFQNNGKLTIDSPLNCILKNTDWEIKFESDDRCKKNIQAFALDELYKKHKDYAYEIAMKSIANQKGYYNDLKMSFIDLGVTDEQIDRIIWGNYLDENQLSDRPLSKMTLDIINQLKSLSG
ncbi:HNH endonuclease [Bacteroides helcogenes]|uniref:HNH domain-containing protein n=1 Tax=Bacteroides helcogenes (strain ATCC 35417 / DSM 20613 / JCM 6297 / CCUG 15421 / P 36-108) TaxID=693979 RepID=E6SRM0_BACT6|nr:HNH endonuclease [Bacteroides helcogenes]ADV45110.1 hypothetical protein Bache_3186 [Bacteroides helcogenes P 36-108]MDY5238670.1 hypothetical protein [Bacteroides helcogenes]